MFSYSLIFLALALFTITNLDRFSGAAAITENEIDSILELHYKSYRNKCVEKARDTCKTIDKYKDFWGYMDCTIDNYLHKCWHCCMKGLSNRFCSTYHKHEFCLVHLDYGSTRRVCHRPVRNLAIENGTSQNYTIFSIATDVQIDRNLALLTDQCAEEVKKLCNGIDKYGEPRLYNRCVFNHAQLMKIGCYKDSAEEFVHF